MTDLPGPAGRTAAPGDVPAQPGRQAEAERALQAVESTIRAVLGRSIGPTENFFEAGLTSAVLVHLHEVARRELSTDLPVTVLFAHPNLRALRRYLTGGHAPVIAPGSRAADAGDLRRLGSARRDLRRRIRSESEPQ